MDISKIKRASYNPRKMSKDSRVALKHSIETFDDISGITVNKRTGNIVSGNHRFAELCKIHGKENLILSALGKTQYHSLDHKKGGPTGFLVRIVDWDEGKEKAANVTANSELISGDFTSELQDVLNDLNELNFDMSDFDALRLDELQIDLDGLDDDFDLGLNSTPSNNNDDNAYDLDKTQRESEQRNRELQDSKTPEVSDVKEIMVQVKISVPSELKDEVKEDILEHLAGKHYYGEIIIV